MKQAYMPLNMVHKTEYWMYYENIPVKHKRKALELIGIPYISNFCRKTRITTAQFETLKNFVNNDPTISNNSIGAPAQFDKDQLMKYNMALLKLINHVDFINYSYVYKDKLVMKQMRIQKIINNN